MARAAGVQRSVAISGLLLFGLHGYTHCDSKVKGIYSKDDWNNLSSDSDSDNGKKNNKRPEGNGGVGNWCYSGLIGYCAGHALKEFGKTAIFMIGTSFAALHVRESFVVCHYKLFHVVCIEKRVCGH